MSAPAKLDRRALDTVADLEYGRQVKLGPALDASGRLFGHPETQAAAMRDAGWTGIAQVIHHDKPVTVPTGTRGLVLKTGELAIKVGFVWRDESTKLVNLAVVGWVHAHEMVNHRGSPPMVGEPMPGRAPAAVTTTNPADPAATPSLFATSTQGTAPVLSQLTAPATPAPTMPTTPTVTPVVTAPVPGSLDAIIGAIVSNAVDTRIDAIEAKLATLPTEPAAPTVHHVRVNDAAPVALSHRPHAQMAHVLARMSMKRLDGSRFNVFLTGDAGTGKSSLAKSCAEAMGLEFGMVAMSGGVTEGALVGRTTPNLSTGVSHYAPSALVRFYFNGGVFLIDEIDAADENVMLSLNALIDAPSWHAPDGTLYERHPDFCLVAAANTFGTGANRIYSGRTQLDGAFLNRWLTVAVDYDTELELSLVACRDVATRIQSARVKMRERSLTRWLTTRDVLTADALVGQLGLAVDAALVEVTASWTAEDRAVVGLV